MKLKIFILTIATLFAATMKAGFFEGITVTSQQYNKWASSKNYIAGVQALEDYDYAIAIEDFNKELKQHPANVYALLNRMQAEYALLVSKLVILSEDDSSDIIDNKIPKIKDSKVAIIDKIDNAIGKLNSADAEGRCSAWQLKALMTEYVDNEECDTAQVNACYDKAIAIHPCTDVYQRYVEFNINNPVMFKTACMKWYQFEPNNPEALKNMILMTFYNEEYDQTLQYIQKYQEVAGNDYEGILLMKAESLNKLGRSEESITTSFEAFEESLSNASFSTFMECAYANPQFALSKINTQIDKESEFQPLWLFLSGIIEGDYNHNYSKALELLKSVHPNMKNNPVVPFEMARYNYMLGENSKAFTYLDAACVFPDNEQFYEYRDAMKLGLGMTDDLIKEKHEIITVDSEGGIYRPKEYNIMCSALLQNGNYEQVVELMSTLAANVDNDEDVIDYVTWGRALKMLDSDDEARKMFELQIDKEDKNLPCRHEIALIELGRASEAKASLDTKVAEWKKNNPQGSLLLEFNASNIYYEVAATYALLGEYDTVVDYMQKHITNDPLPRNLKFLERDWRFDTMRTLPQYNTVLDMYNK